MRRDKGRLRTPPRARGRRVGIMASVGTVLTLSLLATAWGSSSSASSSKPYIIGILPDLSGPIASIGRPTNAGLGVFVKQLDQSGGVNGKHVTLLSRDTRDDVLASRTWYQSLGSDGALAVEGPEDSSVYLAVAALLSEEHVSMLSGGAPPSNKATPYEYVTNIALDDEARIATAYIHQKLKTETPKVGTLSIITPSTTGWLTTVHSSVAEIRGSVVADEQVPLTATDVTTQAQQVAAAHPNFVLLRMLSNQIPLVVTALRTDGYSGPVMADYLGGDESVFKAVNDPAYLAIRSFLDPSQTNVPAIAKMDAQAKQQGQGSELNTSFFTYGYAMGELMTSVLKRCGVSCTPKKFNTVLASTTSVSTNGLSGPLEFAKGDNELVHYGKIYGWNKSAQQSVALSGWIDGAS